MQRDSLEFASSSALPDTVLVKGKLMLNAGGFDYKTLVREPCEPDLYHQDHRVNLSVLTENAHRP